MTNTFTVSWEFMGRASSDAMRAANAVASVMECRESIKITSDILEAAAEQLGDGWDADSVESMLDHCSFEVAS